MSDGQTCISVNAIRKIRPPVTQLGQFLAIDKFQLRVEHPD